MTASARPDIPSPRGRSAFIQNRLLPQNLLPYAALLLLITLAVYAVTRVRCGGLRAPGGAIIGRDYFAFYMAGRMVDAGRTRDLYDLSAQQRWQDEFMAGVNPRWRGICLYLNPPHYAGLMSRLSRLGYVPSLIAWWGLSLLAFAAAALCWRAWLRPGEDRGALLLIVALPAWFQAFAGGQNTFFTLLILTVFVALLMKERDFLAGLALSLLAYKFQYLLLPAALLLYKRRLRALLGLVLGGAATLAFSVAVLGEAVVGDYLHLVLNLGQLMQVHGFDVYKQHSWHGFFALALGDLAGPVVVRVLTAGASLGTLTLLLRVWRGGWQPRAADFPLRVAALLIATLLTSPHLFHYDMLLIALPALLWLASASRAAAAELARTTRWILVIGFVWLAVAGPLASFSHIQLSPLLMMVWLVSIAQHVGRPRPAPVPAGELA